MFTIYSYSLLQSIYWCFSLILFLLPQKFVCTTIRTTQLPFKELYNWEGAAEFVADYLNFETLDPAYELVCNDAHIHEHTLTPDI